MSDETQQQQKPHTGSVCWLEVPAHDVPRAQKFYAELFGWESAAGEGTPSPAPGIKSIHMFKCGPLNGAFVAVEHGAHVRNYSETTKHAVAMLPTLAVDSVKDTAARVAELGGSVHLAETEVGNGMGRFARLIDTEGNMVGIWSM